jgi:hypothetical protein
VYFGEDQQTFRRDVSPPFLGLKSKPSKKPAEPGGKLGSAELSFLPELHDFATVPLFIITPVRTSYPAHSQRLEQVLFS